MAIKLSYTFLRVCDLVVKKLIWYDSRKIQHVKHNCLQIVYLKVSAIDLHCVSDYIIQTYV